MFPRSITTTMVVFILIGSLTMVTAQDPAGPGSEGDVSTDGPISRSIHDLHINILENGTNIPIDNVSIDLYIGSSDNAFNLTARAYTDALGSANITNLTDGDYHLTFTKYAYIRLDMNLTLVGGANTQIKVLMNKDIPEDHMGILKGTVVDLETFTPLEGVNVTIIDMNNSMVVGWDQTDQQGEFEIWNVYTNSYTLTASRSGYFIQMKEVLIGSGVIEVDFDLERIPDNPDAGNIEGWCTDNSTKGFLENIYIAIGNSSLWVQTDSDGYYLISDLEAGEYLLMAYRLPDYNTQERKIIVISNGTVTINFTMKKRVDPLVYPVIKGRVLDNSGNPLEGALVERTNHVVTMETFTDENGSFQFEDLETGIYVFRVSKDGYKAEPTSNIYLDYNQVKNITIVLNEHKKVEEPPTDHNSIILSQSDLSTIFIGIMVTVVMLSIILLYMFRRTKRKLKKELEEDLEKKISQGDQGGDEPWLEMEGSNQVPPKGPGAKPTKSPKGTGKVSSDKEHAEKDRKR